MEPPAAPPAVEPPAEPPLVTNGPVGVQRPNEQVSLTEQTEQVAPELPHAVRERPDWHCPLASQHPVQLVGVQALGFVVGQPKRTSEPTTRSEPENERMATKQSLSTEHNPDSAEGGRSSTVVLCVAG